MTKASRVALELDTLIESTELCLLTENRLPPELVEKAVHEMNFFAGRMRPILDELEKAACKAERAGARDAVAKFAGMPPRGLKQRPARYR